MDNNTFPYKDLNFARFIDELPEDLRAEVASIIKNADGDLEIITHNSITPEQKVNLTSLLTAHDATPESPYKILALVNDEFKHLPIENIDFKRHLRRDVALNKHVVMATNGRPLKSEYRYQTELYAEIAFSFMDYNYLMIDRKEHLRYLREDGSYSEPILIKHKPYDLTDPQDGNTAIQERIQARDGIVGSIKAVLSGILMQAQGKSMEEVISQISPWWKASEAARHEWIEFGTDTWLTEISAIDEKNDTDLLYMDTAIPNGGGANIKMYLLSRLNY